MNDQDISMAISLKTKVELSHQCKTENGIEDDENFIIKSVVGNYEKVKIESQYGQRFIINTNQIVK
jgi:hypothetical protein